MNMASKKRGSGPHPNRGEVAIERTEAGHGTFIFAIAGELDLASAPQLKWAVSNELRAGARHVVVDLGQVTFMDSTAIGVLVGIDRSLAEGQWLALANLQPDVHMTFEVTGLDSAFQLFGTVEEALARSAELQSEPGDQVQSS